MAIDVNPFLQNAVTGASTRAATSSLDTDVKKVTPADQEKMAVVSEASNPKNNSNGIPSSQLSVKDLNNVVLKLNEYVEQQKRGIRFSIDEDTNRTVVKLLDSNGDVLKQFPSEDALAILKGIERNKGLFFESNA